MDDRTEFEKAFQLPPKESFTDPPAEDDAPVPAEAGAAEVESVMKEMEECTDLAARITAALPLAKDVANSDPVFDECVAKAMDVFDRLQRLMENVADNEVAPIVGAAKDMLKVALDAAETKATRNLNTVKLQIQKERLELERAKVDLARDKLKHAPAAAAGGQVVATDGELVSVNRSKFLQSAADADEG